jgi:putative transposase
MSLQSLVIKLETSKEEKFTLLEVMKKYNEACNFVADKAFSLKISNKYKLHKIVYNEIRERFGLSSQFAVRIIGKVTEVYKRNTKIKPIFKELGAIQYDQRNSKIRIDKVELKTFIEKGRLRLKIRIGEYQKLRFKRVRGQADLVYRKKDDTFFLIVTVDVPEEEEEKESAEKYKKEEEEPFDILDVDFGLENIATVVHSKRKFTRAT